MQDAILWISLFLYVLYLDCCWCRRQCQTYFSVYFLCHLLSLRLAIAFVCFVASCLAVVVAYSLFLTLSRVFDCSAVWQPHPWLAGCCWRCWLFCRLPFCALLSFFLSQILSAFSILFSHFLSSFFLCADENSNFTLPAPGNLQYFGFAGAGDYQQEVLDLNFTNFWCVRAFWCFSCVILLFACFVVFSWCL